MPINELRSINTFAKTAELGSLRRAAAAQGMSPQAASQALSQLEQHLGVRLFRRTTRSMSLTDEGRQFLDSAQPALQSLQRAIEQVRRTQENTGGPLRIAGPRSTFLPVLWPVLDEFCQLHPEVQPDVQIEDRIGNWVEDKIDVGFRVGTSPAEGVVARKLFPIQMIICAAPSYLASHGSPVKLSDLASHRCSVFRHPNTGKVLPWTLKVGEEFVQYQVTPTLCTNEEDLETRAVLSGRVIALMTNVTAAPHIRAGRLVPLMVKHVSAYASLFLYYGSRTSQSVRVKTFIEHAINRLANSKYHVMTREELINAERKGKEQSSR